MVSGPPTLELGIATLSSNIAITAISVIIFTAFPQFFSVTQHSKHEAHDTDEADQRSREFGSLFPPEEFEYGVPRGNQERFSDSR